MPYIYNTCTLLTHYSYEMNKTGAQDHNLTAGARAGHVLDAIGDKAKEATHAVKSEAHKQKAMH